MKILLKICMFILPLLVIINLYRYFFYADSYEYFGITGFVDYLQTFDMWLTTKSVIESLGGSASAFQESKNIFESITSFFTMVGDAFAIPITVIVDIVRNIGWFISMITGIA